MKTKKLLWLLFVVLLATGSFLQDRTAAFEQRDPRFSEKSGFPAEKIMVLDVRLENSRPVIEKIVKRPGHYQQKRRMSPSNLPIFGMAPSPMLRLYDRTSNIIYETGVDFPRFITVPPYPSGMSDSLTPDIIEIRSPSASIILPYLYDAEIAELEYSGWTASVDIKSMERQNMIPDAPAIATSEIDSNKLYVLIMANNFDQSNMSHFYATAQKIKSLLLSLEPFANYAPKWVEFNIYANATNLGCAHGCGNIDRLICCNSSSVITAAASSGYPYDEIIVVHNSTQYGGGGYTDGGNYKQNSYSSYCVTYGGDSSMLNTVRSVAAHEFGHSFGNLCDEYSYTTEGYGPDINCVNCRANCTDWSDWKGGCIPKCNSRPDYYRPENSIMYSLDYQNFNKASMRANFFPDGLIKRLRFFAGLTGLYAPENFAIQRLENNLGFAKEYINRLSWQASSDNTEPTKSYRLDAKPKGAEDGQYQLVAVLDPSVLMFEHRYLKKNQLFRYRIVALNADSLPGPAAFVDN
jgi:hypothetical protein